MKSLVEKFSRIGEIFNDAKSVIKFIFSHDIVLAKFREQQQRASNQISLKLSEPTRFNSVYIMFNSLLVNKSVLVELFDSHEFEEATSHYTHYKQVKKVIESREFWVDMRFVSNELMKPVSEAIKLLEGDDAHVGLVYRQFNTLFTHFKTLRLNYAVIKKRDKLLDIFLHRWKFMHKKCMGMAHVLNPENGGGDEMHVNEEINEKTEALNQIKEYLKIFYKDTEKQYKQSLTDLTNFVKQYEYLDDSSKSELLNQNAIDYWTTIGKASYPALSKVACKIFTVPASNCSSERNWKRFAQIITKTRNRLAPEKANKLVAIQQNYYIVQESEKQFYDDLID